MKGETTEYKCPRCKCSFEVNFTDELFKHQATVCFCPNCGSENIYES